MDKAKACHAAHRQMLAAMALLLAGCPGDSSTVGVLSRNAPHGKAAYEGWVPPSEIAGLVPVSETADARQDLGILLELAHSKNARGRSIEYRYAAPGGIGSVLASIGTVLDPRWLDHDFTSLWIGISQNESAARFLRRTLDGQRVLESTWRAGESTSVVVFAWISKHRLILVHSTVPERVPSEVLARDLLRSFPSSLAKEYSTGSGHDYVVTEVNRCFELLRFSKEPRPLLLYLTGLTFFLPKGTDGEGGPHPDRFLQEFPDWWSTNKERSQDQWLRERIEALTEEVGRAKVAQFPFASLRVALLLENLSGFRLPPRLLQNADDFARFKENTSRFWKANRVRPRNEWSRVALDIWIDYLESLSAARTTPGEAAAECLILESLARSSKSLPEKLRRAPPAGLNSSPEDYFPRLKDFLSEFRRWWTTSRETVDGEDRMRPLLDEMKSVAFPPE